MKYIGFCFINYRNNAALIASGEVAKKTMIGLDKIGLTRIGEAASIFFSIEKVYSHCSFHLNASAFLNNLMMI